MTGLAQTVDRLALFADPSRVRLAMLLAREPMSVAELTSVTELAQSRVSTHLARLRDAGLLRDEKRGASTRYALDEATMPEDVRALWQLVAARVEDRVIEADRQRADAVVRARRDNGWPERVAGEMERHYSPGRTWEALARALAGLVTLGDVLDVGSGDGTVAELLAPRAKSYTCLDASEAMIAAARKRLASCDNVRFVVADGERVPERDARFDAVLLFHVLTQTTRPAAMLAEAARLVRPGGVVCVATLAAHAHAELTAPYGHHNAGFTPKALRRLLDKTGLAVTSCELTSRERKPPYFEVLTALAHRPRTNGKNGPTR